MVVKTFFGPRGLNMETHTLVSIYICMYVFKSSKLHLRRNTHKHAAVITAGVCKPNHSIPIEGGNATLKPRSEY